MTIHVGSKNTIKIQAVEETLVLYPHLFPHPKVVSISINVPLFGHPKTLQETVDGAVNRAKEAFGVGRVDDARKAACDYSFGIEGGLMEVPQSNTGFMEVSACVIYDGSRIHLGLGPAFEWPKGVTELVRSGKADASQALKQLGLTHHEKIGEVGGGGVGLLTDGRVTRQDFIKYSIMMALIQVEKAEVYK